MDRAQGLFWKIAIACAVLLLLAPMTGRTSWSFVGGESGGGTGGMTHSAGWDLVAPICGLIAIAILLVGVGLRTEGWRAVWCGAIAFLALAAAGLAAWGHWVDLNSGRLWLPNSTLTPAPAVGFFASVGAVGALAALALTVCWWHRPA
jgi:hypothetical protein